VSLIREKLVEGKPVPELDLRLKRLSADHNKTLTQIGESIAASRRILRNLVRNKNSPATE
jgi:hypothetical protein